MTSFRHLALALFAILPTVHAAEEEGWTPLFNGKDLSNWVNVNCAPETWSVADGVIKCTGKPTGALRTTRMYENFIMEVEWRHMNPAGNAGVFIWAGPLSAPGVPFLRAIEVQVLDNAAGEGPSFTTHGDVFPIHGSTMSPFGKSRGMRSFPSEKRSKPSPEWNHYHIEARDGVLRLSVNGKEVSGGEKCVWRKGYIALESEGGSTEWRGMKVKELPASGATAMETADEAKGHHSLYNGADLRGWKTESPDAWKPSDWRLVSKSGENVKPLWSDEEFGDFELIADLKIGQKDANTPEILLRGEGKEARFSLSSLMPVGAIDGLLFGVDASDRKDPKRAAEAAAAFDAVKKGEWNRVTITISGKQSKLAINGQEISTRPLPEGLPAKRTVGIASNGVEMEWASIYIRELKPGAQ